MERLSLFYPVRREGIVVHETLALEPQDDIIYGGTEVPSGCEPAAHFSHAPRSSRQETKRPLVATLSISGSFGRATLSILNVPPG
jgi:hypothetical protein